ncbi:MAG: hypothetical protein GXP45_05235 [bacterium]|nr:hypothetical protein [bacterium]
MKTIDGSLLRSGPVADYINFENLNFMLDQTAPSLPILLRPHDGSQVYASTEFQREQSIDTGV